MDHAAAERYKTYLHAASALVVQQPCGRVGESLRFAASREALQQNSVQNGPAG